MRTATLGLVLSGLAIHANAQFVITPGPSAQQIGEMLEGLGVTILNASIQCGPGSQGCASFTGSTTLPFDEGIMLATGYTRFHAGPAQNFTSTVLGTGSDPDLVAISGTIINDRCVLAFDCIPDGDTLIFDYVFASEEYPQFVCAFNDVFGLFVSGPGLFGPYSGDAVNLAVLPGTITPIGINTVNGGLNNDPNNPMCPASNPQFYVDNSLGWEHVFNGHTTGLMATTVVQPGQPYHFKLAVGDASDSSYDSAVFLKAFSFRSTGFTTGLAHAQALKPQLITEADAVVLILPEGHGASDVQVINAAGSIAAMQRVASDRVRIPTTGLASGVHVARVIGERPVSPVRFVVR